MLFGIRNPYPEPTLRLWIGLVGMAVFLTPLLPGYRGSQRLWSVQCDSVPESLKVSSLDKSVVNFITAGTTLLAHTLAKWTTYKAIRVRPTAGL